MTSRQSLIDPQTAFSLYNDPNYFQESELVQQVRKGNVHAFRHYKDQVNHQDNYGYTALMIATRNGNLKAVRELLKLGANPMIVSNGGDSALLIAERKLEAANFEKLKVKEQAKFYNRGREGPQLLSQRHDEEDFTRILNQKRCEDIYNQLH